MKSTARDGPKLVRRVWMGEDEPDALLTPVKNKEAEG